MMPNVLQYPVAIAGILRAGLTVVNVNPLYTPRELEHQLNDLAHPPSSFSRTSRPRWKKCARRCQRSHIVLANMGDMLGFKGTIVNFVVRKVKARARL